MDYLRRSTRLSAAVRAEQLRSSAEKVKFFVSCTVPRASSFAKQLSVLGSSVCMIQLPQRLLVL